MSPPDALDELTPPETAAAPAAGAGEPPFQTVIEPPRGWRVINLGELWRFRELLFFLAWRDVKVRYKQTLLGAAWAILQPVLMMVVFTIFFSRMARVSSGDIPYPVFVYAGLLPWTFFATAIAQAGNSVVGSERMITKIYFPRLAVPFAAAGAALVDFALAFAVLLILMAWYGLPFGPGLLLAPALAALVLLAALGVGTLLAALNVAYRDFRYVIPFLVQLWLFATPSVYMQTAPAANPPAAAQGQTAAQGGLVETDANTAIGPAARALLEANPMTGVISAFRGAVLGQPIDWGRLFVSSLLIAAAFVGGCLYFRRVEGSFADII